MFISPQTYDNLFILFVFYRLFCRGQIILIMPPPTPPTQGGGIQIKYSYEKYYYLDICCRCRAKVCIKTARPPPTLTKMYPSVNTYIKKVT